MSQRSQAVRLLLVVPNSDDARRVADILARSSGVHFEVEIACRVAEAIGRLDRGDRPAIDLVLLDLEADDGRLQPVEQIAGKSRRVPIVLLSATDDDFLALRAVQSGAQDVLIKSQVSADSLARSLRYAIERHRLLVNVEEARQRDEREKEELRNQSLIDELTGLYNRRGFFTLVQPQIKLSERTQEHLYLLFADLDGLKSINDNYGHHTGDQALITSAEILKQTFRKSDIIARISGDEFVVLLAEANAESERAIVQRLRNSLTEHNAAEPNRRWNLSLSVGVVRYEPQERGSIDDLMIRADELMYEEKTKRRWRARYSQVDPIPGGSERRRRTVGYQHI